MPSSSCEPSEYEAYNARAQLRPQTAERNHVAQLRDVIARTRDPAGLTQLHYALAKELEDLGDFDQAFASLERGATTKRKHMQYSIDTDLGIMDKIRSVYTSALFDGHVGGCDAEDPIFILGMPRTGTTLVERILDSHPQVQSAGELNNFSLELIRLVKESARSLGTLDRGSISSPRRRRSISQSSVPPTCRACGRCATTARASSTSCPSISCTQG